MPLSRAQVVIPFFTNLPEDVMTNTLYFDNPLQTLQQVADEVTPHIAEFYNDAYFSFGMAGYTEPGLATVKWYDMSTPEPRIPYVLPLGTTLTGVSNTNLPTEASIVVSFQGIPQAGIPQARRRGRIYLGGLPQGVVATTIDDQFPFFSSAFVQQVRNSAMVNLLNAPDNTWVVYSPTGNTSTAVANGWVDNAIDTQRRRSVPPTLRNLYP
jgi:hypothetical protein